MWTTALWGPGRGAPLLRVPVAREQRDGLPTHSPPSQGALAGTHRAPGPALRAGPRSGSARPAQAPVVAAVGPLCGALWEPRERALGSWRGRCRGLYGPARPPARAAGAARGRRAGTAGSGADARAPSSLPASAPLRAPALELTWAPPRGHRRPWRCVCLSCCYFCRSRGCLRAPGTRPVTCSTAHAWVRPPEPSDQMGKLRPRGARVLL